jgi:hypothetical protein
MPDIIAHGVLFKNKDEIARIIAGKYQRKWLQISLGILYQEKVRDNIQVVSEQ